MVRKIWWDVYDFMSMIQWILKYSSWYMHLTVHEQYHCCMLTPVCTFMIRWTSPDTLLWKRRTPSVRRIWWSWVLSHPQDRKVLERTWRTSQSSLNRILVCWFYLCLTVWATSEKSYWYCHWKCVKWYVRGLYILLIWFSWFWVRGELGSMNVFFS